MSEPSTSGSGQQGEPRIEADPLPRKVGELGYVPTANEPRNSTSPDVAVLPARHPADRDNASSSLPSSSGPRPTTPGDETASTTTVPKKRLLQDGMLAGIHIVTLFRIFIISAFIAGTGVAWWMTVMKFSGKDMANNDRPPEDAQGGTPLPFSSVIFVHVAFTVITIFELLFLERAIFHARAERYIYVHGMSRRALAAASMGIAPWNRPPLPTYAAALAESGVGTGDVEDNIIAIPPPPAYGNNRDSTLILSSFIPAALRRTLTRTSERSVEDVQSRSTEAQMEEGQRSRPLSYGASQEVDDASQARALETALAKLEGTHASAAPATVLASTSTSTSTQSPS